MNGLRNITLGAVLAGTLASSFALPGAASASTNGRKNTAIALGAIAVQQLLTGKTTTGLLAGAGAAVAYQKYEDAKKNEDRYDRYHRRYTYNRRDRNDHFRGYRR
jgi:uncharacterized membrane protein YebE (DUF533 family)